MRRFTLLCAFWGVLGLASGCAHQGRSANALTHPQAINSVDDFAADLERFIVLPPDHPQRVTTGHRLAAFVASEALKHVQQGDLIEATGWMERLSDIYPGADARNAQPHPQAAAMARAFYRLAARRGDAERATLGLSLLATFGTADAQLEVAKEWSSLTEWFALGENMANHEGPTQDLQRTLEICSTVLPGRWVMQQLDTFYQREQDELARELDTGMAGRERIAQRATANAYLRLRARLRADDLAGARQTLQQFEQRFGAAMGVRLLPLRVPLQRSADPKRALEAYIDLIQAFIPDGDERAAPWLNHQSWQIVVVLAQHALALDAEAAPALLARGRAHAHADHPTAAIAYFEQVVDQSREFPVWNETARTYHEALARQVETPEGLASSGPMVAKIEAFFARSAKRWPGQSLRVGSGDIQATLAEAYFNHGQPNQAAQAATSSLKIQTRPEVLSLLGTVETRRGRFGEAKQRFAELEALRYDDPLEQVHWQIIGHVQLAEVATLSGSATIAQGHWRSAKRDLDALLELGHLDEGQERQHLSLRARTLIHLNQPRAALADIRRAAKLDRHDTELFRGTLAASYMMGDSQAAAELFELATQTIHNSPQSLLYYALWVDELARRSDDPKVGETARNFLRTYSADPWGKHLARHALGEENGGDLRQAAHSPGEQAEALFYEAMRLRANGQALAARPLLKEVLATQMVSFFEYRFAQWLLATESETPIANRQR